jgi:hypothetical protein
MKKIPSLINAKGKFLNTDFELDIIRGKYCNVLINNVLLGTIERVLPIVGCCYCCI